MTIESTILDFQLSNTFEQYESHVEAEEEQTIYKEIGVKTFYFCKSLDNSQRPNVTFQGPENDLYNTIINPETNSIFEASGHIHEGKKITSWIS